MTSPLLSGIEMLERRHAERERLWLRLVAELESVANIALLSQRPGTYKRLLELRAQLGITDEVLRRALEENDA